MVGTHARALAWALALAAPLGCKLEPPPAMEPPTEPKPEQPPPVAAAEKPAEAEPAETSPKSEAASDEDTAKLNALLADPPCDIAVTEVLKSSRAFWSGVGKYKCTYEIHVNGVRYKYTRMIPRDRKREPDEACQRGMSSMESVVRSGTRNCREMQVTDRDGQGLVPLR